MDHTKKGALILIFTNILLWLPLLFQKGIIIQRDFNFPVYPENFLMYHYPMWNYIMSQPTFEQMIRIPMRLPYLLLAALGVDVSIILKLLLVGTTSFLSVSMFLFLSELRLYPNLRMSDFTILIASLLFAFNPVSLQFLGGISLLFSVGALPLLLTVSIKYSHALLKFSILSAILLLLSLGHPFVLLMNSLIWAVFTLIIDKSFQRSLVKFLGAGFIFLGFSAWYFLPYLSNAVSSVSLGRPENVAYSTFRIVSDNNALKILLLERDRFLYVHTYPKNITGTFIHFLALGLILFISFLPAFSRNLSRTGRKMYLLFITGYILSVLFALGEKSAIGDLYYYVISSTPIGWTFRSPLKFQLYEMFFLVVSFAIGFDIGISILVKRIRQFGNGLPVKGASAVLLLFILAGSVGYGVWDANYNSFNPIQIPQQFYEINSLLESLNDPYKVLWYPRYNERPTVWSKGHYISPFDMKSSRKPTYNTYWNYNYVNTILYDYPYSKGVFRRDYFYTFLRSVGVKYIAFHNDRNVSTDERFLMAILERGVPIYSKNGWYLVTLNSHVNEYVFAPACFVEPGSIENIYKLASPSMAPVNSTEVPKSLMQRVSIWIEPSGRISNITFPNLIPNPSFENWKNNTPSNWTFSIDPSITVVSESCEEPSGDCSLNITTTRSLRKTWDFVISSPIRVSPHEKYLVMTNLRVSNLSGIHIKVDYYNTTSGKWKMLSLIPLKYSQEDGWSQYWGVVDVPAGVSTIRVVIASGWTEKGDRGSLLVEDVGVYRIYPCQKNPPVNVAYIHESPTRIDVRINASTPFLLAVNEVYDRGWIAEVFNGNSLVHSVKPIRVYGFINGFWINQTGDIEIVLRYTPQDWFERGLIISLTTFILSTFYIFYDWRRGKGDRWAKRLGKKIESTLSSLKNRARRVLKR